MKNELLYYCSKCGKYDPPYDQYFDLGGTYCKCKKCNNEIYPIFMTKKEIRKYKIKKINEYKIKN